MSRSRLLLLVLAGLGLVVGVLAWLASEARESDSRTSIVGMAEARTQRVPEEAGDLEAVAGVLDDATATTTASTREPVPSLAELGAQLSGHVRDDRGAALARAFVGEPGASVLGGKGRVTQTDESGAFELTGIAPGPVTLVARVDGHEQATLELGTVADGEHREGIEIVLRRGSSVAGRVVWPDGTPAAGAEVAMRDDYGAAKDIYWGAHAQTQADSEGFFELLLLRPGPFQVEARVCRDEDVLVRAYAGEERPRIERRIHFACARHVPADARDLDLVLTRGTPVRGKVLDDRGEPVEDFRIVARTDEDLQLAPSKVFERYYRTGGAFELMGLADGAWTLEVHALACATATLEIDTTDSTALEIVLPRNGSLAGTVEDPGGKPASGATVHAESVHGPSWERKIRSLRSGRFLLPSVPPGEVRLTATLPGAAASEALVVAVEPSEKVDDLGLSLRRPGRITGEVLAPFEAITLVVELEGEGESRSDVVDDGAFAFDDLTPGTFTVRCANAGSSAMEVELQEGETRHVVLDADAP